MPDHRYISKDMQEEWRPVPIDGYRHYEVSNLGRVRSIDRMVPHRVHGQIHKKGQLRKLQVNPSGYHVLRLIKRHRKGKTFWVHRLVALAFIGEPPNDSYEINHIDGDKLNNVPDNLEWCTRSENMQHAASNGLLPHVELSPGDVRTIREKYEEGADRHELAAKYGVGESTIRRILNGRRWSHVE